MVNISIIKGIFCPFLFLQLIYQWKSLKLFQRRSSSTSGGCSRFLSLSFFFCVCGKKDLYIFVGERVDERIEGVIDNPLTLDAPITFSSFLSFCSLSFALNKSQRRWERVWRLMLLENGQGPVWPQKPLLVYRLQSTFWYTSSCWSIFPNMAWLVLIMIHWYQGVQLWILVNFNHVYIGRTPFFLS